jgi:microsomal dipeptidase-like Zn-dependent dipeptidase
MSVWWIAVAGAGTSEADPAGQPPVRGAIDWQAHPAMHIPWNLPFGKGLQDRAPKRRYKHQFKQVMFEPYLGESGVRILLAAAMAAERARNPEQARALIIRQLRFVEDFVDAHADRYALARTPEEVRSLLAASDRMVVVHSIEGGHHLLNGPDDARFWAEQGVALVTVMHLRDDELGGSAILDTPLGPLINRAGARARRKGEPRGLTERGQQALIELDAAGILVDFSHMAPDTVDDALAVTAANGIPPVVTHGKLARIQATEAGWTDSQVLELYRQGGVFGMGLAGGHLDPHDPVEPIPDGFCPGTIDAWRLHYEVVNRLLSENRSSLVDEGLSDDQVLTRLAVGWSSDWNGWLSHSAPVYGRGRCRPSKAVVDPLRIDTLGLAHPGLLPSHWERLERDGVDLEPALRSAERFLQLWEQVRE